MKKDSQSRSWFIVAPNILENGIADVKTDEIKAMDYEAVCNYVISKWCINDNRISCACLYCQSAEGMKHLHIVCESKTPVKFSTVKNTFGDKVHLEETKGNKQQVLDYINKRGSFEEKGEIILAKAEIGELKGKQGHRSDLEKAKEMIEDGKRPREILMNDVNMFKYCSYIERMYYMYKDANTQPVREIKVILCNGESGSGKTYASYVNQIEERGEDEVYKVSDYKNGFDKYNGESVLILDEFRGALPYHTLLSLLDCYKADVPARYANKGALWDTVFISTVLPVEKIYKKMVDKDDEIFDSISQLLRRISEFRYYYSIIHEDGTKDYAYVVISKETYLIWLRQKKDTIEEMEFLAHAHAIDNDLIGINDELNFHKKS